MIYAAFEIAGEVCTFLGAHLIDGIERLVEFCGQMLFKCFGIGVGIGELQHFGECEHMF